MFGAFRFVMAVMVVVTHIGGIEIVAGFAVWGFFMLSGFLMTAVLTGKYGFDGGGLARFALARSIRLLPTYWVTLLLTVAAIALFAPILDARLINGALAVPQSPRDILANLFIVGHTTFGLGRIDHALSPSAWAVDIEILMYVGSAIFIARRESFARITLIVTACLYPLLWLWSKQLIAAGNMETANELVYSFLPAALIPYSIGSYFWFVRDRFPQELKTRGVGLASTAALLVCAFGISRVSVSAAYILALPCLLLLLAWLTTLQARSGFRKSADDLLGQMSYPIYLSHWLCAYLVGVAALNTPLLAYQDELLRFTPAGFFVVLGVTLLVALLFALILERPVERIRHSMARRLSRAEANAAP